MQPAKKVECVKVAVRCRPMSKKEIGEGNKLTVQINPKRGEVCIKNPKPDHLETEKTFTFDFAFDWNSTQTDVFNDTAFPIVESALEGYNGTIFAYGQTGTGKTHTMEGIPDPDHMKGIIPRAFEHIFKSIESTSDKKFLVRASFLEIYNEEIRDLLSKNYQKKLELHEKADTGVYVKDLSNYVIQSVEEMKEKLLMGRKNRQVGETQMNQDSSRSHSIFTIIIETYEIGPTGESHVRVGKLNLVDLAGSERQSKTQAVGERLKEAININQSLTTLGNVISALVDPKCTHIPYRDSKLTRLLQDSLGGNSKTVMIANIGPADYNYDESINTLRYANRAKNIQNKPKINEDPKDTLIREYQDEIKRLREQIAGKSGGVLMADGTIKPKEIVVEKIVKVEDEELVKAAEEKLLKEKEELQRKADEERMRITNQKSLAEEEKKKLIEKLEEKEMRNKKLYDDRKKMIEKLKSFEKQLLHGDEIKTKSVQNETELLKARQLLIEKEQEQRRLEEALKEKEASAFNAELEVNSLLEQVEVVTRKYNTLTQKIQETIQQKSEIEALRQNEKENYLEDNRNIQHELKFMNKVLELFVSPESIKRLEQKLNYSEELDEWTIDDEKRPEKIQRPGSAFGFKKPLCEFARLALSQGHDHPRFRDENILPIEVDFSEKTTEEFEEVGISQKVKETIHVALNEDEDELSVLQSELTPKVHLEGIEAIELDEKPKKQGQATKARPPSAKKRM